MHHVSTQSNSQSCETTQQLTPGTRSYLGLEHKMFPSWILSREHLCHTSGLQIYNVENNASEHDLL